MYVHIFKFFPQPLYSSHNYIVITMKKVPFLNRIVKQGNSLCVRVPNSAVKELDLKEGSEVAIEIVKTNYECNDEMINGYIDIMNKVKELNKFSNLQKRFFAIFNFKFLQETEGDPIKNKELAKKFWKESEKEFGRKFMTDFEEFANIIKEKVVIQEGSGTFVIKEEYRPEGYSDRVNSKKIIKN